MTIRPAAVAGTFYPDDTAALSSFIDDVMDRVAVEERTLTKVPSAIIVPHAGYIYSGLTAAFAYHAIGYKQFHRVVLFGPAHRVGFRGMALPQCDCFQTPLGDISIDSEAFRMALASPSVHVSDAAHAAEHSLEVQLPFLQSVLGHFSLLPICVGMVSPEDVAEVMRLFLNAPDTLVVVSSDLSHFHDYSSAKAEDEATIASILSLRGPINHEQACGATAINALLLLAMKEGLSPQLLDYRNSGDTAGDRDRVVGYASLAWLNS